MNRFLCCGLVVGLAAFVTLRATEEREKVKDVSTGNICHMVYFTLKDNSADARQKLVDACKKYLGDHDGTVYFSAGVIADDLKREVNDRDFDVALQLVFKDRAAHDKYQDHPRHKKFIEENKENWKKVRVFDSLIR
jgi:hypothetical protein